MTNSQKSKIAAREKVARLRAEQARAERRRRVIVAAAAVGAVVVLIAALVVAKVAGVGKPGPAASGSSSSSASAAVTSALSQVPPSILNTVGAGSANNPPTAIKGLPLKEGTKPRVLYIGAEYCPYCAAQRWVVAQALSRFGTWSGLGETTSSATDVDPSTPTLSFHGATLTSRYVSFTGSRRPPTSPPAPATSRWTPRPQPTPR